MRLIFIVGLSALFALSACKKKDSDPVIPNEEELITTVRIELLSQNDTVIFLFRDLDGDGGNDPIVEAGTLTANTAYSGHITLLNESVNPALSITEEVEEEGADHQFFYALTDASLATITYTDEDEFGNPIGLVFVMNTHDAGVSQLSVTLRHEPDKAASGVAEGMISNAGGETDVYVEFPFTSQ